MNKVILMGRLTRDPEVRYSQGENATAVARYTLAVDRRFYQLCCFREIGRICGETSSQRYKDRNYRAHPDGQLHQ